MGTCPPSISAESFGQLAEKRRSEQFLTACRNPAMWLHRAYQHKRGADILYEAAYLASQRDLARLIAESRTSPPDGAKIMEGQELEDHLDQALISEYLLLVGYALECVLKGFLLAIIPGLVINEKRVDKLVANHDLSQLCRECAIRLSPDESQLLKLTTRHIVWGKYTAPLSRDDMPSWIDAADQEEKSLAILNPLHERRVQTLMNSVFARASALLQKEIRRE